MRVATIGWLGWLGWGLVLAAASALPAELREVPRPALEVLEPGVREQLSEHRQELDRLLSAGAAEPQQLAAAFGFMGQLYYLYDLTGAAVPALENAAELAPDDPRWPYYLGVAHQLEGRYEEAVARFRTVLETAPADVATRIRLADTLLELEEIDAAHGLYQGQLGGGAAAAALYGLGRIAEYRAETGAAIELYDQALVAQPAANGIHHRLGMAYRRLRRLDEARDHLARNKGDKVRFPDPLIEGLGQLLRAGQVFFKAGIDALKRHDAAEAIAQLLQARELKGDDPLVHYNLALAYLEAGREAEAEESFRRSIAVDPDFRDGHFNLGTMLAGRSSLVEAEEAFRRAHEIDPLDLPSHREWATALAATGDRQRARQEFEALLDAYPGDVAARLNLAALDAQAGDYEAAAAGLAQAAADGSVEAEVRRASLLERMGRREAALEAFAGASALEPRNPSHREQYALALGRSGRFAEAAREFEVLLELTPGSKSAHMGLAMSHLLGDREPAARTALEAALSALPGDRQLTHLLARLLVTASAAEVRDGPRGLTLAQRVFEAESTLEHAETMAMALAEVGDFAQAVEWQRGVVEQRQATGAGPASDQARARLDLYQRGEPCRSPWASG